MGQRKYISWFFMVAGFIISPALMHCTSSVGEPWPTAINVDRKRGCAEIREVNWGGSMKNNGTYDADDDFIEIQNSDCNKPIDLTDWRIELSGDVKKIYYIPAGPNNTVSPGAFKVIIAKASGAFRDQGSADYKPIVLTGLAIPERNWSITTRTAENFLMESGINTTESDDATSRNFPLSGAFDGYTVRSMERTEDTFEEEGGSVSTWHASTPCNETSPSGQGTPLMGTACSTTSIGASGKNVHADYHLRTFATPGEKNTPDYK
ncbi:MAG: hypothetical protein LDLANPLL_02477 [Turneriella sp.]|nr:hypothetical protein [Turneriella sp.]